MIDIVDEIALLLAGSLIGIGSIFLLLAFDKFPYVKITNEKQNVGSG